MSKSKSKNVDNWLEAKVEDKYSKKGELEHILELPDTQIGSTEFEDYNFWVPLKCDDGDIAFKKQDIQFTPGLYKIIDEILVNAYDQAVRLKEIAKKVMKSNSLDEEDMKKSGIDFVKTIKIEIKPEEGYISVYNDGEGVDVEKHPEHKVYVPQMIFGDMRTSSNYNKNETGIKIVGGRNGFGAKLANIFSTKFIVETIDGRRGKHFYQEYENNMTVRHEPIVKDTTKKAFTKITFYPDLERFDYKNGMDENLYKLVLKRAYDLAACTESSISVYLNDEKIDCKNFEKYVNYYLGSKSDYPRIYKKFNDRWEIVACTSPDQKFDQVSFVNGVSTIRGGKHVEYISKQLVAKLKKFIQTKKKITTLKSEHVKDNIMIFVKCSVANAAFDTQTKECLTTTPTKFESVCDIDDAFVETLAVKCGVMEQVYNWHQTKLEMNVKKTDGTNKKSTLNIPKLEDATWAGSGKKAQLASLILTEGDSAKALAMAGRGAVKDEKGDVIGTKMFGVFPLKGKVMNVDGADIEKIMANQEITNIKKILGLQEGKVYKDTKSLRYGSILIMCDQDSVTGDTPLLLKNENNELEIKTIDSLVSNDDWNMNTNGKEYANTTYSVWTEKGWSTINNVIRHKVNKNIYKIGNNFGYVKVTEDHSLLETNNNTDIFNNNSILNIECNEISPNEAILYKTKLVHSFPSITDNGISNEQLQQFKQMYYNIIKNVDDYMKDDKYKTTMIHNPIAVQVIYAYLRMQGYYVNLRTRYCDVRGITIEMIDIFASKQKSDIGAINFEMTIKENLGNTEQYVYDLETTNHHFQAGVGNMIVHNTDGSHIKGLLINLFKTKWPSLLELDGFITSLLTPVIKAKKGKTIKSFYSMPQFENWAKNNNDAKGWNIKYYKGLGTSTPKEAKEYFQQFKKNIYTMLDYNETMDSIGLAFDKKRADDRKNWLQVYDRNDILDYSKSSITYKEFIDKDLKHFSHEDNRRSIPNIMDGLKESQRKILYGAFKKGLVASVNKSTGEYNKSIKVAQLAGYIGENAAYHHGEASLNMTITGMAQTYVGSNNINLLAPAGQFGTRLQGGKDAASPRYIETGLETIATHIFNKLDEPLYNYLIDDGQKVEPEYYAPIIPMILVNGTKGIGTGYSTDIPSYKPTDVIKCINDLINGKSISELTPWYRGFKGWIGKISGKSSKTYLTKGIYKEVDNKTVEITELPIGVWTEDYKKLLIAMTGEKLVSKSPKKGEDDKKPKTTPIPKILKKFEEAHTDTSVKFILYFESSKVMDELMISGVDKKGVNLFEKTFKLTSSISINNMVLYDANHRIKKYNSTTEIIEDFFMVRQELYVKRRKYMLDRLKADKMLITWKAKFIMGVISEDNDEKIYVNKRSKKNIYEQLEQKEFPKEIDGNLVKLKDIEQTLDDNVNEKAYNYLLSMSIYNLTQEKIDELLKNKADIEAEYETLKAKTHLDLWNEDLDNLENAYSDFTKHYWKSVGIDAENEFMQADQKRNKKKKTIKIKLSSDVVTDDEAELTT
jgi:DNA gyrase/topoisomerase IV subunit B